MPDKEDLGGKGKIRIGISQCLIGDKVRYDGGHKLDRFLTDTLGKWVEYVPVCPEVECGMQESRHSTARLKRPLDTGVIPFLEQFLRNS